MSARNSLAIRRINKDIREITRNPVEGIGISSIEDNPMRYVINMRLMNGPYEGYCVQLMEVIIIIFFKIFLWMKMVFILKNFVSIY